MGAPGRAKRQASVCAASEQGRGQNWPTHPHRLHAGFGAVGKGRRREGGEKHPTAGTRWVEPQLLAESEWQRRPWERGMCGAAGSRWSRFRRTRRCPDGAWPAPALRRRQESGWDRPRPALPSK